MDGDGDVDVDGGAAQATNAGSEWAGKSPMETKPLFSQQFMLQQRMKDLHQEMISLFSVQRSYLQNSFG
jgi:hypothetical protein